MKEIFTLSAPERVGISQAAVDCFVSDTQEMGLPIHSILLLRHGQLVCERYCAPYDKNTLHRVYSVSKSFVALAIGLLVGEGRLSVHDRVSDYFPERLPPDPDPLLAETTVEQLLTMSPPFSDGEYDSLSGDPVENFFRAKATHPAGTIFSYNAASPAVLTALVERLTGESMLEYMRPRLLDPIGVSPEVWCVGMPCGGSWGASGILCTPRDLARIGLLLLNDGAWEGRQLLSAQYVRAACGKRIDSDGDNTSTETDCGYGYFIWRTRNNGFAFLGMGCQVLLCLPDKEIVLVTTGDTQSIRGGSDAMLHSFWNTVYASACGKPVSGCGAAPALRLPLPLGGGSGHAPAPGILDRDISMEPNPMGILRMRFHRTEAGILWLYENRTGKHQLLFGQGQLLSQEFPEDHYYSTQLKQHGDLHYLCQAGGTWSDPATFLARVYITDVNVGTGKMTFRFQRERVSIYMAAFAEFFLTEYQGFGWGRFDEK